MNSMQHWNKKLKCGSKALMQTMVSLGSYEKLKWNFKTLREYAISISKFYNRSE